MINEAFAKTVFYLCCVIIIFVSGWVVRGWKADSDNLIIAKAVEVANVKFADDQKAVASQVEVSLSNLAKSQRSIENEKINVLKDDIYSHACFTTRGVSIINSAKQGNYAGGSSN